jgi:hypothetical protein
MTASSANMDKSLTQHDMNASRFLWSLHVIDPESTANDDSKIATMAPLVTETPPHRRRHRRQNAQFNGFFEAVDTNTKDRISTPTSVTPESALFATNTNPATDTDSIANSSPNTSPYTCHNAYLRGLSEETTTTTKSTTHSSEDSSHLMQWQIAQRYMTNTPVSPYSKGRHTCSVAQSDITGNNDRDFWAQGVTQLSQLYAAGLYQKQRGEILTEDYFFRNDAGQWNHLEWHSSRQ